MQISLDDQKKLWIDITKWLDSADLTISPNGEFPLFPLVCLSALVLLCHHFCLFLYFFRSHELFFEICSFYVVLAVLELTM